MGLKSLIDGGYGWFGGPRSRDHVGLQMAWITNVVLMAFEIKMKMHV
jgi:hypothetical protein